MTAATEVAGALMPAEFIDAPRTVREAFPMKYASCDSRVPSEQMEDAIQRAWIAWPNATNVTALWTPASSSPVCVEVWIGRRARVVGCDRIPS